MKWSSKTPLNDLFKINEAEVYLTSYSVTDVKSTASVLSRSFATVLEGLEWPEVKEFVELCRKVNDLFDMLNGSYGSR